MYIKVKVTPGSKREEIAKISEDHYEIKIREKAEHNYANTRILEIFRNLYPNTSVKIVSGHHSPSKIISLNV